MRTRGTPARVDGVHGHESSFRTAAGAACVRRRARWPGAVQDAVRRRAVRGDGTRRGGFVDVVRRVRATTVPARAMRAAAPRAGRAPTGTSRRSWPWRPGGGGVGEGERVRPVEAGASVVAAGGRAGRRSAEGEGRRAARRRRGAGRAGGRTRDPFEVAAPDIRTTVLVPSGTVQAASPATRSW